MVRALCLLVGLSVVLLWGRVGYAEPDCNGVPGRVLFSAIPESHYDTMPHLRRILLTLRREHPRSQVQLVRLRRGTAQALLAVKQIQLNLLAFGECVVLPRQHFREVGLGGMRVYGSTPQVRGDGAYVTVLERDPGYTGPGDDDPFVYLSGTVAGRDVEVRPQLGGNPNIGRLYAVFRSKVPERGAAAASRKREAAHRHDAASAPPLTRRERAALRRLLRCKRWKLSPREPIDIAVGYTVETLDHLGTRAVIQSIATAGAEWWEDSLRLSGGPKKVRVAVMVRTRIQESDYADAYGNVDAEELCDVAYDNGHLRFRRRVAEADVVTLMAHKIGNTHGWGYIWEPLTAWPLGARGAYSVINHKRAGRRAIAHECSHNIGCGHVSTSSTAQEAYAHAWCVWLDGYKYCTVMASSEVQGSFEYLKRYSDPGEEEDGEVLGTASNDNVRLLERNLIWVAHWGKVIQYLPP